MNNLFGSCLVILLVTTFVKTDNDGTAEAASALASPSTANSTKVPVEPTDYICRACVCKDNKVDCTNQDVTKFFSINDWAGIVNITPTEVDLSDNPIAKVTHIYELPIEVLNLSRCNIEDIEIRSFKDLQKMRILDLSHNKLTTEKLSPHAFEGLYQPERYEPLSSMRILNLAYNELHSLNQDLFEHLPDLTELNLSGNPMKIIDYPTIIAISSLPMLQVLKLRSCEIKEIPEKFLHTPRNLVHLDLSDNRLDSVPQELDETKNLEFLNLNQNPIAKLEEGSMYYPGFPTLSKLKELHMCNMDELTTIGKGTLAGLRNLQVLHLSYNAKLNFIHPKALARADDIGETYDWPPISELYLRSNNLSEVDSRLLSRWDLVRKMNLSNNPYLCDCSTQWMVDYLVEITERLQPNSSNSMECSEPIEMRGDTMKQLHDGHHKLRCVDKYGHRPERDGAILLGTLIGVLLAVPIMLSIMLMYKRGYFSCCGIRGPGDFSRAFYKRAQSDDFAY